VKDGLPVDGEDGQHQLNMKDLLSFVLGMLAEA